MLNLNFMKMRKITKLSAMTFSVLCMSVLSVFGQIPPEQAVVIIPAGVEGIIETTINEKLPADFQSSEYLMEHGFVDKIVRRTEMKSTLALLLSYCVPALVPKKGGK